MNAPSTRRTFLMRGGALLAGATLASAQDAPPSLTATPEATATPSPSPTPIDRVRFAVIGCRGRGNEVGRAFLDSGLFELKALADCDDASFTKAMEKFSAKGGTAPTPKFEKDFRRVLEDKEIEAVVIATPDHWHAAMTVMAFEAGKHVYCEKPLSYNIADGIAMVGASRKHPTLAASVGSQQRSGAHFQEAHAFIKSGALGKIGFARGWISQDRGVLPILPDSPPPATLDYDMWVGPAPFRPYNESRCHYKWRFIRDYGTGEMGNWGAHWLDIIRLFLDLDLPTAAVGTGGQYITLDAKEWPDTQTVLFDFPNLTVAWEQRIWTKNDLNGDSSGAEFIGENGRLVISRAGWSFFPADGPEQRHKGSDLMGPHVRNYYEAVRNGAKLNAPMEEGHKTAVMCHLANLTVELKRRLAFDTANLTITGDTEAATHMRREYRDAWRGLA